jgi:hypothetical protein
MSGHGAANPEDYSGEISRIDDGSRACRREQLHGDSRSVYSGRATEILTRKFQFPTLKPFNSRCLPLYRVSRIRGCTPSWVEGAHLAFHQHTCFVSTSFVSSAAPAALFHQQRASLQQRQSRQPFIRAQQLIHSSTSLSVPGLHIASISTVFTVYRARAMSLPVR